MDKIDVTKSVDAVKLQLNKLNLIKLRQKRQNNLIGQLALASKLKHEMSLCTSDRSVLLESDLTVKMLSDNHTLILLGLKNKTDTDFQDWSIMLEISSIASLFCDLDSSQLASTSSSPNSVIEKHVDLPVLKRGTNVQIDVHCDDCYFNEYIINCYLIKQFSCGTDNAINDSKKCKIFRLKLNTFLITVLDYVVKKDCYTYLPFLNSVTKSSEKDERFERESGQERLRFSFAYSCVRLISGRKMVDCFQTASNFLLKWLFPSIPETYFESKTKPDDSRLTYPVLVFNTDVMLSIESKELQSTIQLTFDLEGTDVVQCVSAIHKAVVLKYLFLIHDALNTPQTVDLDMKHLRDALRDSSIEGDFNSESSKSMLQSISSKFVFV